MRWPLICLAVLAAGCAQVPRSASFPEQMAREASGLSAVSVDSPEQEFSTVILGELAGPMQVLEDGSGVSAVIEIGSAVPVECVFFDGDIDLASALIEFSETAFEEVTKHSGPIIARRVQQISAGAVEAAPLLSLAWRYRVATGVGLIKQRIASVDGHGLYCRHVEVGYRKTFARLFESIAVHLERKQDDAPRPSYASVALTRLRNQPRGVEKHVVTEVDEDTVRIESRYSMLTSSRYGRLSAIDTIFVRFSRRDGTLINSVYARSEDGQLVTNLTLDPNEEGWVVQGTLRGAKFSRETVAGPILVSTLGEALALEKAIGGETSSKTVEVHGWYPHVDPTKPKRRVIVLGQRQDMEHFNVISKVGSVVTESVVDRHGQTTWSRWLDASIGELETRQLFVEGRL